MKSPLVSHEAIEGKFASSRLKVTRSPMLVYHAALESRLWRLDCSCVVDSDEVNHNSYLSLSAHEVNSHPGFRRRSVRPSSTKRINMTRSDHYYATVEGDTEDMARNVCAVVCSPANIL